MWRHIFYQWRRKKFLSRDSNYIVDMIMWPKSFLWEKLSWPQVYKDLTRKTAFFEGWSSFKLNNLGLALGTNLKFYTSVEKGLNLKVRKFWGLIPTFVEVTGKKVVGERGLFCRPPPSPILNRVKVQWNLSCYLHDS